MYELGFPSHWKMRDNDDLKREWERAPKRAYATKPRTKGLEEIAMKE
jgi:hypothetical protein